MPITEGYRVICSRSINKTERESVIMIPITEKEEHNLDNGYLHWVRGSYEFIIEPANKPIYGLIDFTTNSDDYHVLETMNWLDWVTGFGIVIPANYDYEHHCCYSPIKIAKTYDTSNPAKVAQYLHGCLGKPERVCIFKRKQYGYKKYSK